MNLVKSLKWRYWALACALCVIAGTSFAGVPTKLLDNYPKSFTSFKYARMTNVQDVRPTFRHRATNLNGSYRSGGGGEFTVAPDFNLTDSDSPGGPSTPGGAPICPNKSIPNFQLEALAGGSVVGGRQIGIVDLFANTYQIANTDLSLDSPGFSWVVGRSFNARQEDSGGSHHDSDGYQGWNWFQNSQPEIVFYDDASAVNDVIYIIFGADNFVAFTRATVGPGYSIDTFTAVNGAGGVILLHTFDGVKLATYYTLSGERLDFFWFDGVGGGNVDEVEGSLWRIMDSTVTANPYDTGDLLEAGDGNIAYVGDIGDPDSTHAQLSGYVSSGDVAGAIEFAYDTAGRRYEYKYADIDPGEIPVITRLISVEVATYSGSWTNTGYKVEYDYYHSQDNTYGDDGCLQKATITTPLTDSGINDVKEIYYRYWTGTFNASTNPGHPYTIQYLVAFEGTRNLDWSDSTWNDSYESTTETILKEYADSYFEYDSSYRVSQAWFNGECGCSSNPDGLFKFTYEDSTQYSDDTANYDEEWFTRTVVERPDGSWVTQYFDEVGQAIHHVVSDADPASALNFWVTMVDRDSDGRVAKIHSPANVTAYTHANTGSWGITVSINSGLVTVYDRLTTGDLEGLEKHLKHQTGSTGTEYFDSTVDYETTSLVIEDATLVRPFVDSRWVYTEETDNEAGDGTDPAGAYETTTVITFYTSASVMMPKKIVTTYEAVVAGNNGSGSATTTTSYLRTDGTIAFSEDQDSSFIYTEFTNNRITKLIVDAQTNHATDFDLDPNGHFSITESSAGLRFITEYAYDSQDRLNITTLYAETASDKRFLKNYYSHLNDRRLVMLSYADYEDLATDKYYGPVNYTVLNHARSTEVQALIALPSNESTLALTNHVDETTDDPILAIETTTNELGEIEMMNTSLYNKPGNTVEESRAYFLVPASGAGSDGTNYDPTKFGYDDMGKRWRVTEASGTISRTVRDKLGRTTEQWIGKNDFSFSGGTGSGPDNMVKTVAIEYDSGNAGENSYVTKQTSFVEDSTSGERVTTFSHDVRGRVLLQTNPLEPKHVLNEFDNVDRLIATAMYDAGDGTDDVAAGDDPVARSDDRLSLTEALFDERGQLWMSIVHKIDDADGSDDDSLETENWFDATGRTIKVDGSQLTKIFYDRIGRETHTFILAVHDDGTTYTNADDVAGDIVLQENQTHYESFGNDVIMTVSIDRYHDDFGGSENTGALDTNADADDLLITAANLKGRVNVNAMWYDRFSRITDAATYGLPDTDDDGDYDASDTAFDRDGLADPDFDDSGYVDAGKILLTEHVYNTDGTLLSVTDPMDLEVRSEYDDLGRRITLINNYVDGSPSGVNGDDDVHTRFVYTDGLQTRMFVDIDADGTEDSEDQITIYTYSTEEGTDPGDSKIDTGHLLQKIQYPDSSGGSDVVTFAYNAQNQLIWQKDQLGTIIETVFDDAGRQTDVKVTALGTGVDDYVKRISTTYNTRGQTELVTQYSLATGGTVRDEVKLTNEDWLNISKIEQDHDSTVATGGDLLYDVDFTYAKATAGRNTVRRTSMDLPDGNVINFSYVSIDLHDGDASRVSKVEDGVVALAEYKYNGVGHVVGTDLPQPDVFSHLYGSTSGLYPDMDRFNRVTTSRWTKNLATDRDIYNTALTYDANSNITLAEDNVHTGFDVDYTIDNLNRLQQAEEGTWSGSAITSGTRNQIWEDATPNPALSQTGNWDYVKLDLDGDNNFTDAGEYKDDRTYNAANELTAQDTDDDNTNDYLPTYDDAGNLTDDKKYYEYVYDAFGRLRKVNDTSDQSLVVEYKYNGLGHRISWLYDTDLDTNTVSGTDSTYHFVYDDSWRIVGTFRDSDDSPKEQFVYHNAGANGLGSSSYIDAVVCRDKDANTAWTSASDGTLEQRFYYCQNWRGDVSVIIEDDADMVEWVKYSAFGIPFGLPLGDVDSNGLLNVLDYIAIVTYGGAYDVRYDLNLNGVIDGTDATLASAASPITLGWGNLSDVGNRKGYAGYELDPVLEYNIWHARNRVLNSDLGMWMTRDPQGYVDGANLYEYVASNPIVNVDPYGLFLYLPDDEFLYLPDDEFIPPTPDLCGWKWWSCWKCQRKLDKAAKKGKCNRKKYELACYKKYQFRGFKLAECIANYRKHLRKCLKDIAKALKDCVDCAY